MRRPSNAWYGLAACAAVLLCAGCDVPGRPKSGDEISRPEQVLDARTLYKQNCSGCHGDNGANGAALSLNNPAYLAIAGESTLRSTIANGQPGTLMPPFAKSAGGMLTDQQVEALTQGILHEWSQPAQFAGTSLPAYASTTPGDASAGQKAFVSACARCHGEDGMGAKTSADGKPPQNGSLPYPIADPTYLTLVNNQTLRSLILAGRPDEGMPDWRNYFSGPGFTAQQGRALSSDEVNNIVAWLAAHRPASPIQVGMKSSTPGTSEPSGPESGSQKEPK